MNFKVSRNKQVVLTGLQAENVDDAVSNMEHFLDNLGIKTQETIVEENIAILFLENNSRMFISQDKTQKKTQKESDTEELIALVQMDQEKDRIVCSTIKMSSRRAAKAPDAIRRKFSELGGKFKDKTITGKAGWQFLPEKEVELRQTLVDAGITIDLY